MDNALYSKMVKAGKNTYFLDVKEARNGSKYLTITSSFPSKQDRTKFNKRSINVFADMAQEFATAVQEASAQLK
jgi:hypothetical protein